VPLSIVVHPANSGDILDVEFGDASPSDAPGWADRFDRPLRRRPSLYHSRNLRDAVLAAMAGRAYDWWAATLDGTVDVPGAVAVQYCGASDSNDPCRTTGHYDESIIFDPGWINLQPPDPPPPPKEPDMFLLQNQTTAGIYLFDGARLTQLTHQPNIDMLITAGVKLLPISDADFKTLQADLAAAATGSVSGQLTVNGSLTGTLTIK